MEQISDSSMAKKERRKRELMNVLHIIVWDYLLWFIVREWKSSNAHSIYLRECIFYHVLLYSFERRKFLSLFIECCIFDTNLFLFYLMVHTQSICLYGNGHSFDAHCMHEQFIVLNDFDERNKIHTSNLNTFIQISYFFDVMYKYFNPVYIDCVWIQMSKY